MTDDRATSRSGIPEVGSLDAAVHDLFDSAVSWAGTHRQELEDLRREHDDVLTVALAGWMKAGKSTLLNALLGEVVAATDAGECTKMLTFYRYGDEPRAVMWTRQGERYDLAVEHGPDGAVFSRELNEVPAEHVSRLEVFWPAAKLRRLCLIDTPGLSSPTPGLSARTRRALQGELSDVALDAVVYLVRHLHPTDVDFLQAFAAAPRADAGPVNAVAVLARADEIGLGHGDGLHAARLVAGRYRRDERLRRLVHTVAPLDARLACGAAGLTDDDVADLVSLSRLDPAHRGRILLSAELLLRSAEPTDLDRFRRSALVSLLGLSGLRLTVGLLAADPSLDAAALRPRLRERSGIEQIEQLFAEQFTTRARLLKARATLVRLDRLARSWSADPAGAALAAAVEAVSANAVELAELGELNRLRQDPALGPFGMLDEADRDQAERILGGMGGDAVTRVGLSATAPHSDQQIRVAAAELAARWRAKAEGPWSTIEVVRLARVVVRRLEGLAHQLAHQPPGDVPIGTLGPDQGRPR